MIAFSVIQPLRISVFLSALFLFSFSLSAQDIRINELSSSNTMHADADGDYPDWFELYNFGDTPVSLNQWGISDNESDLRKWVLPDISLQANEHLLIWASSKDRKYQTFPRTLINHGDDFKYIIPNSEPDPSWNSLGFDDSSWSEGPTGIGYADNDDATIIPEGTKSVYVRRKFNVSNIDQLIYMILDIDYDDGFVAYINDTEIARANIEGTPPLFDDGALEDHEALMINFKAPERYYTTDIEDLIIEGENVLCIQIHNTGTSSSDLSLIPFLTAIYIEPTEIGISPPDILNLPDRKFHTNFKLSAKGEPLILTNEQNQIIDQLPAIELPADISIGKSGMEEDLVYFVNTTPGHQNDEVSYLGILDTEVIFSHPGGLIEEAINLNISGGTAGQSIRYTTDATLPTGSSTLYDEPLTIDSNTVIRARIYEPNYIASPTINRTYISNQNHEIDLVLLTTDPYHLFDEEYGIYVPGPEGTYNPERPYFGANFWEDWERPIHMAFYDKETSNLGIEFNAGVKIYGGWSRGQNEQRSLALYARSSYGDSNFEYPFFEGLHYDKFENIVLRNSGQDFLISSIKDIAITSLMEGSGLEYQAYRPVATYINGDYWGMYHMREKVNEHMLASKFNLDADDITLLNDKYRVVEGSNEEYIALIDYITETDLSDDVNFEYVKEQIDLENYALYQTTEIYINNGDWPGHNTKYWKHPEGKWRWILYDTDFGFGPNWETDDFYMNTLSFALEENGPEWPNPPWATLLFRRLITNTNFKNTFINRYADELNSRFLPDHVKTHFDEISASIASEVEAHYTRWDGIPEEQAYYVDEMKIWAENRPAYAKEHIMAQFELPAMHSITIFNVDPDAGFVKLNNNLKIHDSNWQGEYFETVPIELKAIPETGYEFSYWSGASTSTEAVIHLNLEENTLITPHFIPTTNNTPLVINEINYKSSAEFNPGDWVELYNPNDFSMDLSNWILKDNNDHLGFYFPEETSISPQGYLVITKDLEGFQLAFPHISNVIGDLDFGLSSDGDAVRLFNQDEILQDEVAYLTSDPWPTAAAGQGPTLELTSPDLDNTLSESWKCWSYHGSPGKINLDASGLDETQGQTFKTYPNPVNNTLYITGIKTSASIKIYSISGQELISTSTNRQIDVSLLDPGVYILDITEDNQVSRQKLIKR